MTRIPDIIGATVPVAEFGRMALLSTFDVEESIDRPSYPLGFPAAFDCSNPNAKRVLLPDVNRLGEIACREQFFRQCGGIHTFNREFSDAAGGYPEGIELEYWDGERVRRVVSLIDDNTFDFVLNPSLIDGVHWDYSDEWRQRGLKIYYDFNRMELANVMPFDGLMLSELHITKRENGTLKVKATVVPPSGPDVVIDVFSTSLDVSTETGDYKIVYPYYFYAKSGTFVRFEKSGCDGIVTATKYAVPLIGRA